jgi:hypothetical protein
MATLSIEHILETLSVNQIEGDVKAKIQGSSITMIRVQDQ